MSDPQPVKTSTLNRRKFLTVAGAGVAGGSLLTMLEARQAPAQIKGTTLRILQWSHFIPAYDAWFDNVFVKEWGEKNGVKVRVDHIPHLELPARMAAEYAAGAGHDIIHNSSSILTRLYYRNLVDISDIYEQAGKKHGGWKQPPNHPQGAARAPEFRRVVLRRGLACRLFSWGPPPRHSFPASGGGLVFPRRDLALPPPGATNPAGLRQHADRARARGA